jgi:hypothetical protein
MLVCCDVVLMWLCHLISLDRLDSGSFVVAEDENLLWLPKVYVEDEQ